MVEKVNFQERSNELFCALLFNAKTWKARTNLTIGIKEHLPTHRETSNGYRDIWETRTVQSLQF